MLQYPEGSTSKPGSTGTLLMRRLFLSALCLAFHSCRLPQAGRQELINTLLSATDEKMLTIIV